MADVKFYNDLVKARAILVARRREIGDNMADPDFNGISFAPDLRAVQELVEAVDRAIADEIKLGNKPTAYTKSSIG